MSGVTAFLIVLLLFVPAPMIGSARAAAKDAVDTIEDNSFLVEEAYNQEKGVVQHTLMTVYNADSRRRGWSFNFSQEWPVFSQDHQFSFSIPWYHVRDGSDRVYGMGDLVLNYRYQALDESDSVPAFAPSFGLILPTGNRNRGTGDGVVGYEWSLPFSKKLGSHFAVHANAGLTYLPGVRARLNGSTGPLSKRHSLVSYNFGASGIVALLPRFHLLLEWIGESEESINDAGKARRAFLSILSPGFRTAVINQEKLQVVFGAAAPIGLNRRTDNYGALFYLSIEHDFH